MVVKIQKREIQFDILTLLHSEWPKLYGVLAIPSAIGSRGEKLSYYEPQKCNKGTVLYISVFVSADWVPRCDKEGYYEREQCHDKSGYCWCVDLNGNMIADTKKYGSAHCSKYRLNF